MKFILAESEKKPRILEQTIPKQSQNILVWITGHFSPQKKQEQKTSASGNKYPEFSKKTKGMDCDCTPVILR